MRRGLIAVAGGLGQREGFCAGGFESVGDQAGGFPVRGGGGNRPEEVVGLARVVAVGQGGEPARGQEQAMMAAIRSAAMALPDRSASPFGSSAWTRRDSTAAQPPTTAGAPISLVKVVGQDGGMTTWFRTYYEDEDLWLYFEAGGQRDRLRSGGRTCVR
ncbi:hypothetical protein [Streptomyces sp. NRRL F-2664]|uniref:hypothetical protein n=1 Tax=Streptomyces sp. NRRL F-2664 TaxID=1463842 RepID=UPI0004CB5B9B|nr:hypothetical protein [Streptomyces sp. NRRL F-2664]